MAALLPQSPDQHTAREEDVDNLVPSSPKAQAGTLPTYKSAFLQACLSASVLTFGDYTLKSGRQSPYFFNAGLFYRTSLVQSLSTAFAETLLQHKKLNPSFEFDVLFGPAYKGIPLAAITTLKLGDIDASAFGDVEYSFNRKEVKDHGEKGGLLVGAPLKGKKVVVIDDVITAGTAIKEAVGIIREEGGTLAGVVIALNRLERMNDESPKSAIQEVQKQYGVPVLSIIDLNDLIGVLGDLGDEKDMLRLEEYKRRYGASDE